MKQPQRWMLAGLLILALAACGTEQTPSAGQSPTSSAGEPSPAAQAPQTPTSSAEAPSPEAQEEAAATNPLCDLATLAEVQGVVGGNISKVDVLDVEDLTDLSCIYLDEQDFNNGLTIKFVTTDKLVKLDSPWKTAADYFAEWSSTGEPVAGLGEGAAWVELTSALYVLKGDTVMQFSASSTDTKDAAVRAKFETLAQQVVGRMS